MEQSVKRIEDLVGRRVKSAIRTRYGSIVLGLDCELHAVFAVGADVDHEAIVILAEPDVGQLADYGLISVEQLQHELREEVTGQNWERVKELARAADTASRRLDFTRELEVAARRNEE